MQEFEKRAMDAANRIMAEMMSRPANPLEGEEDEHGKSRAKIRRRRHSYLYWESPDQRLFCYTPWKDRDGNYWTWVMKPFGKGARSGKATKWKRVGKLVRSRTRKTARKRARTRYKNWMKYLRQEWRDEYMATNLSAFFDLFLYWTQAIESSNSRLSNDVTKYARDLSPHNTREITKRLPDWYERLENAYDQIDKATQSLTPIVGAVEGILAERETR